MSRPTHATVGGARYEIVWRNEKLGSLAVEEAFGHTSSGEQTIVIGGYFPPDRQRATLLHELIHACANELLTNNSGLEEAQVVVLASGLMQAFNDNPALLAFLAGSSQEEPAA